MVEPTVCDQGVVASLINDVFFILSLPVVRIILYNRPPYTLCLQSYTNKVLTEWDVPILLIVSPNNSATDKTVIFEQFLASPFNGIVLVTTNRSIGDSLILLMAGPDSTGCVQHA
jgi:hypothetical protein